MKWSKHDWPKSTRNQKQCRVIHGKIVACGAMHVSVKGDVDPEEKHYNRNEECLWGINHW